MRILWKKPAYLFRDTYISKEDALWFQADGLVTMVIVQEVFETQERESTHLSLVFQNDHDRQFTRLQTEN